jgi:hypothetical protein
LKRRSGVAIVGGSPAAVAVAGVGSTARKGEWEISREKNCSCVRSLGLVVERNWKVNGKMASL